MGKLDPKRDYYADLEVAPDASSEDIKKQFRKLALKYHPDRHPGQEADFIAKFQAIQSAHEALEDPVKRAEYDEERRKAALKNFFARPPSSGRRGNPYTVNTDFPPPPSRTRPRNPPDMAPPTSGSGATRYAQFSGPAPPKHRERPRTWQEAQAKNNIFTTYQNMSSGSKGQAPRQPYPVPPPYQPSSHRAPPGSTFQRRPSDTSPQRSAYEETHRPPKPGITRTHSTRVPRAGGFDADDAYGDGYSSSSKYDRSNPPRMPNGFSQRPPPPPMPPRGQAPTAKRPDHPRSFRSNSGDDVPFKEGSGRESTPYMSHPSERTYFDSDALRKNMNNPESTRRHRSLSPISRTTSMNSEPGTPNLAAHHARHSSQQGFPQNMPPRPYATYSPDEGSGEDAVSDRSAQDTETPDMANRPKAKPSASWTNRSGTSKHGSLEEQSKAEAGEAAGPRSPHDSSFDTHRRDERFSSSPDPQRPRSMENMSRRYVAEPEDIANSADPMEKMQRTESHPDLTGLRGQAAYRSFTTSPIRGGFSGPDPSQSRPIPRSAPADPDTQIPDILSKPPKSAGDQPENGFAQLAQPTHYFDEAPHPTHRTDSFSTEEWSEELKNGNWAENWARGETSPTRSSSQPTRRSRTGSRNSRTGTKPANVPKPVSVGDDIDEAYETPPPHSHHSNHEADDIDENAMDIDEKSPPTTGNGPTIVVQEPSTSGVRHVYVEPQRRDWQNHVTPVDDASASASASASAAAAASASATASPAPTTRPGPPPASYSSSLGMSDLRKVPPFSPEESGLRSFADLSSALPFPSQPAASTPLSPQSPMSPLNSILLRLPRPPILPKDPDRLTAASWETHLVHMRAYMSAWNTFNRRIVDLLALQAAKYCGMEAGARGGMVDGWLSAVGGTRELGGWDAYVKAVDEDRRVREYWAVACEKHADVVGRHGRLRERAFRGDFAAG